jgi:methyl-accepting chemotaxis protein
MLKKLIALIQKPRLALRWKLLGGFLITNLVVLVVLLLALVGVASANQKLASLKNSYERSQVVTQIELSQNQVINFALDYIWSDNLARYNDYQTTSINLQSLINSFQPSPLQTDTFTTFKQNVAGLHTVLDQIITLDTNHQTDQAISVWRNQGTKQAVTIREQLQELSDQELHQALVAYEQAQADASNLTLLLTILAVVGVIIAIGIAFLLTAAMTQPIRLLRQRLTELAKGDLTGLAEITNRDELGDLGQTFNTTISSLTSLIRQLYNQSQQISVATQELNVQTMGQVAGSSQQATAISEATQSVQELAKTAEEIAHQATKVSKVVEHCLERAHVVDQLVTTMRKAQEQGRTTIASAIQSLQTLKESIAATFEQQQTLARQSSAMQSIIEVSENIAKQTHLLALNAAIEAAGAGVYGERFSVIAAEVKQLAAQAMSATTDIASTLAGIGSAIILVGTQAEQGLKEAEQAVAESTHSDEVFLNLTSLVGEVQSATHYIVEEVQTASILAISIGTATDQQQVSSKQTLDRMLEIEVVTSQNLSSMQQGEAVTLQLSLNAEQLAQAATTFQLAAF